MNNEYMMLLECKTYNTIFEIKDVEASIIIANPKIICTSITNIMQNLIMYGNIGTAGILIDKAKQDLHIDIFFCLKRFSLGYLPLYRNRILAGA